MSTKCEGTFLAGKINPFRAPEPLPILNPSNFVPKNGFPVVKGLSKRDRSHDVQGANALVDARIESPQS